MTAYFATVAKGLEEIAAQELTKLGAENVQPDFAGVHFTGDRRLMYQVNLSARTIFRVLMPIAKFRCVDRQMLYEQISKIDWSEYLTPENTLAVHSTGGNDKLNHTHFTALQVKDAITAQQSAKYKYRSHIDTENPDIIVNTHIHHDQCIVSLDSTGNSLHRRGYRLDVGAAPLRETLAAAILQMAEYDGNITLFDPMCGSGTLPLEASWLALQIPPAIKRENFTFMQWLDFQPAVWEEVLTATKKQILPDLKYPIIGSDYDRSVLKEANHNAKLAGVEHHVEFIQQDFADIEPPSDQGLLICNPPYGARLGDLQELKEFYQLMGDVFKQRFKGWTAYVLTGNRQLMKSVGLRTARRIHVYNGSIECTLMKYELY